ncbi:MAG: GDYXXLXY domain-containing protein [Planctomycetota bacterium]|jgi:uncharacterized membrane-anchored protein|nr:GDYXXLXY domain-containing protein [Planctomycetota bacterium]
MRLIDWLKRPPAKYLCLSILPLAVLLYLPASRSIILAFGEPVLLEARPVDPRDWLRGDFVVLGYEIAARAAAAIPSAWDVDGDRFRDEVYVTLEKDGDGIGAVKEVSRSRPAAGLYLAGTLDGRWAVDIDFGIGAYYVQEGTGGELEDAVRRGRVLVDVRVLRGRGVINALKVLPVRDDGEAAGAR